MDSTHPDLEVHDLLDGLAERGESLVGTIAAEIARAITEGELAAGDDLNSVELANRFGTSRTPVREALMLLEKEGLVEIQPRRRPRVAEISWRVIEEVYLVRAALNALMIELVAKHATAMMFAEAEAVVERMRAANRAKRRADFVRARHDLHVLWGEQCGNETLRLLLRSWKFRMSMRRFAAGALEDEHRSLLDHERVLLACRDREPELAATLIRSLTLSGLRAIAQSRGHKDNPDT